MPVRKPNPTSPGLRHATYATFEEITKTTREKSLVKRMKKHCGRNHSGQITVRHQGGGHKKIYRMLDFKQTDKLNIPGKVTAIEYDPARTAYIMLVVYQDGDKRYHLAPDGMKVGEEIVTRIKGKVKLGNRMMLSHIPVGFQVHNIEMRPGQGGKIIRSAGTFAVVASVEDKYVQLQLPSGETRIVPKECYASIGIMGNIDHSNIKIGKAGRRRWMGWRPTVRGKAMNAVDHPHGGGKGLQPIGHIHPMTPWGKPTLGFKTRKRHAPTNKYIIKSRHSNV